MALARLPFVCARVRSPRNLRRGLIVTVRIERIAAIPGKNAWAAVLWRAIVRRLNVTAGFGYHYLVGCA